MMKVRMLTLALALTVTAGALAQPKRIVRIGGDGEDPTKDWPKIELGAKTDPEIQAALGKWLDAIVARDLFSGTVLVARNGEPLFFKSYGLANKDWNVANTNDTKYAIGSINKIFTKVALLQLRDAGKLDFSKTLRTYLPDYPSPAADRITLQQIIDHRSGLGDIFGEAYDALPKSRLRSLQDYLPLFVNEPLEFEPGARQRYSNAGYVVLGLVIEKVSGMSYYDYVRTKIYAPAGMTDSDSFDADAVVPRRAVGYTRRGPTGPTPLHANVYTKPAKPSSAGGGDATAMDLTRFVRALPKLLGEKTFREEFRGALGIGGGAPGMNAAVEMDGNYAIVVLSNYDPPAAEGVGRNVRALLGLLAE